jgi:photosystem II stability/assembly factor-like uncharacterized protein
VNAVSRREQASTFVTGEWRHFPGIDLPSPVVALLASQDNLWAGGFGGVARYTEKEGWVLHGAGLALRSVTALAHACGSLVAGGEGGIARSLNGGLSWQQCSIPGNIGTVTDLALSPRFQEDGTALAATLDNGILRSTDSGQSWQLSSFGLQSPEVAAIAWGTDETVIAATPSGLFRSPNAGRAWRILASTENTAFAALAAVADGEMVAASDSGPLLLSSQNLTHWSAVGDLPVDIRTSAVLAFGEGRLALATANHGILLSVDDGGTWSAVLRETALSLAADDSQLFAGTAAGVLMSQDGGETWTDLPPPPLYDLHRTQIVAGLPVISGTNSPAVIHDPAAGWRVLSTTPLPLAGLFASCQGALLASTPQGLFRSEDRGGSWQVVVPGAAGCVTQMTFDAEGRGWAGVTQDGALLRTEDDGRTWTRLAAPFGVLPLVALQAHARPGSLVAATYDDRQHAIALWRSLDSGVRWRRGADAFTPWPVVATWGSPPVVTVGNVIAVQQPDGMWHRTAVGEMGIRRVVGSGALLVALVGDGLWRSDDHGAAWSRDDMGLPLAQIADIALAGKTFYALLGGGWLWSRQI